jgi:hypothetical protein
MASGAQLRGQLVTFRALDRVVYLLAVGFVWSSCVLNAPLAIAAPWPSGESGEGSAPQRVAVEDVQRILAEARGKSDAEVARQLSGVELTERMSYAKLKSLEQNVPGKKSRWALVALSDASVFLSPAVADVLPQAPSDLNEQRRMVALTVEYLGTTLPKLPNFYATRTTVRFGDGPNMKRARAKSQDDSAWRIVGNSKVVVAYRDGKEVVDPREWVKHPSDREDEGLITRGVFGPILSTVILDAARAGMTWARWERGSAGTLAVFRYRVPKNQSHYSVAFHGLSSGKGDANPATGYLGEVAIDPATGTILRLTVQADLALDSPILRGDVMVEYGPVEIGGKTYTCPIRSVSISLNDDRFVDPFTQAPQTNLLNDVTFTDYHQFRAESRILPGYVPAPKH